MKKYIIIVLTFTSFGLKGFSQNKMDSVILDYAKFLCETSIGYVNEIEVGYHVVHRTITYDSVFVFEFYANRPMTRRLIIRVKSRMEKYGDFGNDFRGGEIKTDPFCEKILVYSYRYNRFYKILGFNTTDINAYLFDHQYDKRLRKWDVKYTLEEFFPEWTKKKRRKFKRLIWKNRKMMDFINQENCYERTISYPFIH